MRLGNEIFLDHLDRFVAGKRIGLVVNQTSFTSKMTSLLCACRDAARVVAVFGPEHGFHGVAQDMESIAQNTLPDGTPIFSLYGAAENSLRPTPDAMRLIDAMVFDIQDVGARYYTFIWTLSFCMEACAASGVEMIVLDRPNPLGGEIVSGPMLRKGYESFVGRFPMPVRHGMTVGEIARWLRERHRIACRLTVVPMEGWRRAMWFDGTGLPWIPPSPNMPTLATAIVYPGACLVEGTTMSEGRGTTTPFECVGAPGLNADRLARRMNGMAGCLFRPTAFVPGFQKHAGRVCSGLFVHVTDRNVFDAFSTYGRLLCAIGELFPAQVAWRGDAYEFVRDIPAVDLLVGSDRLRLGMERGLDFDGIFSDNSSEAQSFMTERKEFLLYD